MYSVTVKKLVSHSNNFTTHNTYVKCMPCDGLAPNLGYSLLCASRFGWASNPAQDKRV